MVGIIILAILIVVLVIAIPFVAVLAFYSHDFKAGLFSTVDKCCSRAVKMYWRLGPVRAGEMSYERFLDKYNSIYGKFYGKLWGESDVDYAHYLYKTALFRELANLRRDLVEKYMMGPQFRYDVEYKELMLEFNKSVPSGSLPVVAAEHDVAEPAQPAPIVQNFTVNSTIVNNTENNVLIADIQNTQNNIDNDNRISVQNVTNLPPAEVKEKKYEVPGSTKEEYSSFKELMTRYAPNDLEDKMRLYFASHKSGKEIGITKSFLDELGYLKDVDMKVYVTIIKKDFGIGLGYTGIMKGLYDFDRKYPSAKDRQIIKSLSGILNVKHSFFVD